MTVDYATSDGTATAGEDYMATSGTLSFAPGETSRTVAGHVVDAVGERLRDGSGGSHVTIAGRRLSLATGSEGATALHDTADMPGVQPARFGPAADTGP